MTGGVGDHDMSTSPATTARAAAVPLSNGRISHVDAVLLEEALLLRDVDDHHRKDRRNAGRRDDELLAAAMAAAPTARRAARRRAPRPAMTVVKRLNISILPYLLRVFISAFENEFGFARLPHQRAPDALAQLGEARQRAACRACAAAADRWRWSRGCCDGLPLSTITRWPSSTASSIEWVTKIMAVGRCSQMRSSSNCRISRVCASTAANGSSISSTLGSTASARASPQRCCMPPDI